MTNYLVSENTAKKLKRLLDRDANLDSGYRVLPQQIAFCYVTSELGGDYYGAEVWSFNGSTWDTVGTCTVYGEGLTTDKLIPCLRQGEGVFVAMCCSIEEYQQLQMCSHNSSAICLELGNTTTTTTPTYICGSSCTAMATAYTFALTGITGTNCCTLWNGTHTLLATGTCNYTTTQIPWTCTCAGLGGETYRNVQFSYWPGGYANGWQCNFASCWYCYGEAVYAFAGNSTDTSSLPNCTGPYTMTLISTGSCPQCSGFPNYLTLTAV